MSLQVVTGLADRLVREVTTYVWEDSEAESDHFKAMLAAIKAFATALTPLVGYIAQPVPRCDGWKLMGVYLSSCGGYLLASGLIYLPPLEGLPDAQRDIRNPTVTVLEILKRRTIINRDTQDAEMLGLLQNLRQSLERALQEQQERQKRREGTAASVAESMKVLTTR